MSKIYEALENAGEERAVTDARGGGSGAAPLSPTKPMTGLEEKLLALYKRVDAALDGEGGKLVALAPVQSEKDGLRLACTFAKMLAARLRLKVLFLGAYPTRYLARAFPNPGPHGWEEVVQGQRAVDEVIHTVGGTDLSMSLMATSSSSFPAVLAAPGLGSVLEGLRDRFDLILIGTPSLAGSAEAALLSAMAQGVVVVVEADQTRWQVIKDATDQIAAQGGRVLGTLLNRQRHYIPGVVYRKL